MYSYQERLEIEKLCSESEIFDKYVNMMKEKNDILLSHMTHEIGNPLALISGTIQLMDRKYKELADIKYWNQLKEDVEALTKLLKSYSVYNNCSKLNASETNLLELVHSIINATAAMREEKKLKMFVNEIQEPMPCLEL